MRVTQSMLSNNMLTNLSNSYERLAKLQNQITTQKKFSKPSDDPAAAMMGMTYRKNLNQVEQYSSNMSKATSWTETTDSALGQAISALQRIRELAVQASNGTYESNQRGSIAAEIAQLKQHLIDIGDTQLGGQYIFNGYKTNTRPSDNIIQNTDPTKPGYVAGASFTEVKPSVLAQTADITKTITTAGVDAATPFTGQVTVNQLTNGNDGNVAKFTVDFTSAFAGKSPGDITSVSMGGREYSFTIGATDADSTTNLVNSIQNDITNTPGVYTNITTTGVAASGSQISFTANAADSQIKMGTFSTTPTIVSSNVQNAIKTDGIAAVYTYELKANFTAGDFIKIGGQTYKAGTDFAIGTDTAATTANLLAKLQGTTAITNDYKVAAGSTPNSITITANKAGVDKNEDAYSTYVAVYQTLGQYQFKIPTENYRVGQTVTIAGQEFEVRSPNGTNDGTGFKIGATINETAANLLAAINANTTLNGKFDTAILKDGNLGAGIIATNLPTDAYTIVLQEKVPSGDNMASIVGVRTDQNVNFGAPSYSNNDINIEVFDGIKLTVNTSGKVFEKALSDAGSIQKLYTALNDSSINESDITNLIGDIDETITSFIDTQAQVGAKQNRINLMADRLGEQEVIAQKVLSNNEDVDMEKVIVQFTAQESVHNAALSVGAKIIQPSLLDFLR